MSLEEICSHFGNTTIYQFNSTIVELGNLMEENASSYNYIIANDIIYFVAMNAINDVRVEVITQGVN